MLLKWMPWQSCLLFAALVAWSVPSAAQITYGTEHDRLTGEGFVPIGQTRSGAVRYVPSRAFGAGSGDYWVADDRSRANPIDVLYTMTLWRFECSVRVYAQVEIITWHSEGRRGPSHSRNSPGLLPVVPGSGTEVLLDAICGQ
jgi:hypothetical protein